MIEIKKRAPLLNIILLTLIVALLMISLPAKMIKAAVEENPLQNELGINPDNIPKDPEELKDKYLSQEWAKIISESKFLGPIHRFLINIPWLFEIIIAEPYSLTLSFFLTFVLWLFAFAFITDIIKTSGLMKKSFPYLIGIGGSIILAQIKLISHISTALIEIAMSKENVFFRIIIWIFIIAGFSIVYMTEHLITKNMAKNKKKKSDSELKSDVNKNKIFRENIIKGMED